MHAIRSKFRIIGFILLISLCVNKLGAQTPADDPGIGGPGTSDSAPAGDGAPIVPFDKEMNLAFLVTGIYYVSNVVRRNRMEIVIKN